MQDTLAPVSQTAVTRELQTSRFLKTLLLSMTEMQIAGSWDEGDPRGNRLVHAQVALV